jgi:hypothetical protein
MAQEAIRDRIVLLTSGMSAKAAEGYCVRQGNLDADAAGRLVTEARQRIERRI